MATDPFSTRYANETYLQSLAASKSDATRALQNALSEISRQRQVGQDAAGQIPGAANTAFNTSQQRLTGDIQSLGLGGPLSSALQAFNMGRTGYQNASGLLSEGFNEQSVQRTGGAKNIVQQVIGDITGKGNEYVSRRDQEERERAYREAEAARQRALQEELANRQYAMQQQALAVQAAEADRQRQFLANQAAMDRSLAMQSYAPAPSPASDYDLAILAAIAAAQSVGAAATAKQPVAPSGSGTSSDFRTRRIL